MPIQSNRRRTRFLASLSAACLLPTLTACVYPVTPIGAAIPTESGPTVQTADCRTLITQPIERDPHRRSRSQPCLELEDAVFYFRYDGGRTHLIGRTPDTLVKQSHRGKVEWRLPISVHYRGDAAGFDRAKSLGHDADTDLVFVDGDAGLHIIRARDGAFLAFIRPPDRSSRDPIQLDLCPTDSGLFIGSLVQPFAHDPQQRQEPWQQWHFLPNDLLTAPRKPRTPD